MDCPGFLQFRQWQKEVNGKLNSTEQLLMRLIETKRFNKVRKSLCNHFIPVQPCGFPPFLSSEGITSISKCALASPIFSNDVFLPHDNFNVPRREKPKVTRRENLEFLHSLAQPQVTSLSKSEHFGGETLVKDVVQYLV